MALSLSLLKDTKIYQLLADRNSNYLSIVDCAATLADNKLKLVTKAFESYTLHDLGHSKKVMDYMLALASNKDMLSDESIVMMIYAALFHDVGMALTDKEINDVKTNIFFENDMHIDFQKVMKSFGHDEKAAIAGIVRSHHGRRSARLIRSFINNNEDKINSIPVHYIFSYSLLYSDSQVSFAPLLASICESHEQSISWIESNVSNHWVVYNNTVINGQYIACLLRLADLLDFDCDRAPRFYEWIREINPSSQEYFYINQIVYPGEKIFRCNVDACLRTCPNSANCGKSQMVIKITGNYPPQANMSQLVKDELYGKCLEYFEYTEREIQLILNMSNQWKGSLFAISVCNKIEMDINKPEDLAIDPPKKLEVEYPVIRDLFLGENLYKDKKIGLRELIQNAYDACKELQETYAEIECRCGVKKSYKPEIRLIVDPVKKTLSIHDNGIGMSFSTITSCFLHVGKSIYEGDKYRYTNFHSNHIGHFGIGFFAAFMLSKHVEIRTKYFESNEIISVRLADDREYVTIVKRNAKPYDDPGTSIILDYDEMISVFGAMEFIETYITENFIDCGIIVRIELINDCDNPKTLALHSIGDININQDIYIQKINLSKYFNKVDIIAHMSSDSEFRTEVHSIRDERNFLYNGVQFAEVRFDALEEYITSCKKTICFYKIVEADCNLFVPELYWLNNQPPFGFQGFTRTVNISYASLPIFDKYCFSDFMADANINIRIPGRASVQELNAFGVTRRSGLIYYERNKEFTRNALTLYLNQACGEADKIDAVFIRNVLIPNFHIKVPFISHDINIANINCNIFTENIFPTTDRIDVHRSIANDFSYAVGKALTLYQSEHAKSSDEKQRITEFINAYYKDDNVFLKKTP